MTTNNVRKKTVNGHPVKKEKMFIKMDNFYLLKTAQCLIDDVIEKFHQKMYSQAGGNFGAESQYGANRGNRMGNKGTNQAS